MKFKYLLVAAFMCVITSVFAQTHEQGIEYYKADQYNNAEELLKRNLNNSGTDKALSYYYLGQIEYFRGNSASAKKYFDDGISLDPNCPYNYIGLGYMALKNNDLKTAEKYFKEAESKSKKDPSVMMDIARAYYNADNVAYKDKYEKIIQNALKKDNKNPDIYILQGDMLRDLAYQTGDSKTYGSAAAKYEMASNFDPTSSIAYVKYANMYTRAQNPSFAIMKLEELLNNNPQSALGQRELANLYYDNSQYEKASEQYGKYVNNPNHFKTDEDRYAMLLYYSKDYKKGYDFATQLLALDPQNFTALRFQFINATKLPEMADNLISLADNLMAAHKSNKDNTFALIDYKLLNEVYQNANRRDDERNILMEAQEVFPNESDFYQALSLMYIDDELYAKATDEFLKNIEHKDNPDYVDYATLGLFALNGGLQNRQGYTNKLTGEVVAPDENSAKKYLEIAKNGAVKASELYPTWYKPYQILGDVERELVAPAQEGSAAVNSYTKAIELFEAAPDARYNNDARKMYIYLSDYYRNKDNNKANSYASKANALN